MKKQPLSLEECKSIQLEMLKEIDIFCREHKICYSLAFGTLLGAIRHKGYIPWDDDVDIMMPLPDMLRFKEQFKSGTITFCDLDTENFCDYEFARIANTQTYREAGIVSKSYGVCIDLYPVVAVPSNEEERSAFFNKAIKMERRCASLRKWRSRIAKCLPVKSIPFFRQSVRKLTCHLRCSFDYGETGMYYIIADSVALREKMTFDFDLFDEMIDVMFENKKYLAVASYDQFLKRQYGDYMTPPPENQRHPYHCGKYYWK